MENNIEEIYSRVFEDISERFIEVGFPKAEKPVLYYDEDFPIPEMEAFLNESWIDEEHKGEVYGSVQEWTWDGILNMDIIHTFKDNVEIIPIEKHSCDVFSKFYEIDRYSLIEIIMTYTIAKWFFWNVYSDNDIFYNDNQQKFINPLGKKLISTWAQLIVYKLVENRPKLVNVYNDICECVYPEFFLWRIIKSRSFRDIVLDMKSLRRAKKPSLSAWRTIMLDDEFWLKAFRDSRINFMDRAIFFDDEDAYRLVSLWYDKKMIGYANELMPYLEHMDKDAREVNFYRFEYVWE